VVTASYDEHCARAAAEGPLILRWHRTRLTNAATEGTNLVVKNIKRLGFRNIENYRLRLLLRCGAHGSLAPSHQYDAANHASARRVALGAITGATDAGGRRYRRLVDARLRSLPPGRTAAARLLHETEPYTRSRPSGPSARGGSWSSYSDRDIGIGVCASKSDAGSCTPAASAS
jgi:hypothetical protein